MDQDTDWRRFRDDLGQGAARAGIGVVRITLLFGAAAAALALIATPYLDRESRTRIARVDRTGIDTMATGSILRGDSFTVRRSVLQATPRSECVIRENGRSSGDC